MKSAWQIIQYTFFIIYFGLTFYAVWEHDYLINRFQTSVSWILILVILGLLILILKFIALSYRAKRIEYEFTSIVNHTFRTPLTRIMWYSKELEKDLPSNERGLYVQDIANATNRMLDIVDLFAGIKNINDSSGYFFQATSLRDIVEKTIAKYRSEINKRALTFEVSTFKDAPMLTLDLKKITFVVDTLIENAIFYTPKSGKITIDYKVKDKILTFFVADTGIGLNYLEKNRIFNRFYRSKKAILMNPDGMGLKLYLSKQIIRLHHGEIYVTSQGKDKGAVFFIKLPLA